MASYMDYDALVDEGGLSLPSLRLLNGKTRFLLVSILDDLRLEDFKHANGDSLTEAENDDLDAILSKAKEEIVVTNPLIGSIHFFAVSGTPDGFLLCDGSSYAREDYPDLYEKLAGTTFIVDDDNFTVPNLIDRFLRGSDEFIGDEGGEAEVTLTTGQLARHSHQPNVHSHAYTGAVAALGAALVGVPIPSAVPAPLVTAVGGNATQSEGNDEPHNNIPPFTYFGVFIMAM